MRLTFDEAGQGPVLNVWTSIRTAETKASVVDAGANFPHHGPIPERWEIGVLNVSHRRWKPGRTTRVASAGFLQINLLEKRRAKSTLEFSGAVGATQARFETLTEPFEAQSKCRPPSLEPAPP